MTIDARIADVKYGRDGHAVLTLAARPGQKELDGPKRLTVLNPPAGQLLDAAIGCDITGDGNVILMGQRVWANRHGGTKIKLRSRGLVTQ